MTTQTLKLKTQNSRRTAATAAELAVVLPLLAFLMVVIVDFCRAYYYSVTLNNCARNGALYASDPYAPLAAKYVSAQQAAQADAFNLSPAPNINVRYGSSAGGPFGSAAPLLDGSGNVTGYVQVTATWQFNTVTRFPGVPSPMLTRSVVMRVAPRVPD